MKYIIWIVLALMSISIITGCSRTKRIANDVDWIVFDGEPAKDN